LNERFRHFDEFAVYSPVVPLLRLHNKGYKLIVQGRLNKNATKKRSLRTYSDQAAGQTGPSTYSHRLLLQQTLSVGSISIGVA
jgi:hypothetical protein